MTPQTNGKNGKQDENGVRLHWARQVTRKTDYLPHDANGQLVKITGGGTHPGRPMLAAGCDLDFILRALFPHTTRKQRQALAKLGGVSLDHRIYVRYTPYYLSIQRHGLDTTLVYLQNGFDHRIGEVKHLPLDRKKPGRVAQPGTERPPDAG